MEDFDGGTEAAAVTDGAKNGGKRRPSDAMRDAEEAENSPEGDDAGADERAREFAEEAEALRDPEVPFPPWSGKPSAARAAKVADKFVAPSWEDRHRCYKSVQHDHAKRVVVASDRQMLIVTKHGYKEYGKMSMLFPDYTKAIVADADLVRSETVNPSEVSAAAKRLVYLARNSKHKYCPTVVSLWLGDRLADFDAGRMAVFAEAMALNGMTEVKSDAECTRIVAKNDDTTLVLMATKGYDLAVGRGYANVYRMSGYSGRIVSAPDRSTGEGTTARHLAKLEASARELLGAGEKERAKTVEKSIAAAKFLLKVESETEDRLMRAEDAKRFLEARPSTVADAA